jgi:outer membrane protein assembly factor BamC
LGKLEMQERFDRAWRRVGLALDRVGFTVEDRDRAKGLYFVRYLDPEIDNEKKEEGILSKLKFWKANPSADPQTQYRVFVKDEDSISTVQVLSREGGADQSEASKKILALLYDQLK